MSNRSILSKAVGTGLAATFFVASPAMALDAKQCLPMSEMNAALKAEGQRTMIIGDRVAMNDDGSRPSGVKFNRYVNTVTSNNDGSVGYQLEGDLPRVQSSTRVCVAAKLTNVRLYDARVGSIPQSAFLGGKFDAVVRENAAKGTRPMLVADTVHSSGNGAERRGLPLVMFGNVTSRTAGIATKLPDGKPQFLVGMADTDYTQAAIARFGTQVATNSPR